MFDVCERVDLRTVNKRVMENLIKAGAFDSLGQDRAALYNNVDRAIDWGQRKQHEAEVGQGGLFAMMGDNAGDDSDMMVAAETWPEAIQLAHEKETLGFYITGHPLRQYITEINAIANTGTANLADKVSGSEIVIGGIVAHTRTMRTRKGDTMGVMLLEDLEGMAEVLIFPDTYSKARDVIVVDAPVIVKGKLDSDESNTKILASDSLPVDQAQARLSTTVTVAIDALSAPADLATRIQPIIEEKTGQVELVFELRYPKFTVFVRPNPYLKVLPDKRFVQFVEEICGPDTVKFSR